MFKKKSLMLFLVAGFLHCAGSSDDARPESVIGSAFNFLALPFRIQELLLRQNPDSAPNVQEQEDLELAAGLSKSLYDQEPKSPQTAKCEEIIREEEQLLAVQIESIKTAEQEKTEREEEERREKARIIALEKKQFLAAQIESIKTEEARIRREKARSASVSVSVQTDATPKGFDDLQRKEIDKFRQIAERPSMAEGPTRHDIPTDAAEEDLRKTRVAKTTTVSRGVGSTSGHSLRSSKPIIDPDVIERRKILERIALELGGSLKDSSEGEGEEIRSERSDAVKRKEYLKLDKEETENPIQKQEEFNSPSSCAAAAYREFSDVVTQSPTTEAQIPTVSPRSASSAPAEEHPENPEDDWVVCDMCNASAVVSSE